MNLRPTTISTFAAGLITGTLITASIVFAAPAKAMPDTVVDHYAAAVCATLDDYPTFDGIIGIGVALHEDGWTYREAGEIVGTAVFDHCPRHTQLMLDFAEAPVGATA